MHYTELRIYQRASQLRDELFKEIEPVLNQWEIPEIKQVIRSSASIVANIVEGHSRRFYPKDFYRFLVISLGSSDETQVHIEALFAKKYLSKEKQDYFKTHYRYLSIKILNLMNHLKKRHKFK